MLALCQTKKSGGGKKAEYLMGRGSRAAGLLQRRVWWLSFSRVVGPLVAPSRGLS
jgi:hypothetical protein